MAIQRRIVMDRYPVCKEYIMTRGKALTFPAEHFGKDLTDDTVYGAVIDMPMGPRLLTTMVCYINGAANLYFNLGGDYSGAAQRHPGVVQAARSFILNAGQYLEDAEKVTQFDLPRGRTQFVYLLTKGGIYKLAFEPANVPMGDKRRVLLAMYQRVMGELRNAQLKDQSAAQNGSK